MTIETCRGCPAGTQRMPPTACQGSGGWRVYVLFVVGLTGLDYFLGFCEHLVYYYLSDGQGTMPWQTIHSFFP